MRSLIALSALLIAGLVGCDTADSTDANPITSIETSAEISAVHMTIHAFKYVEHIVSTVQ